MSDLIDRQMAIDFVKNAWAKGLEPSQYIELAPSAERWIPVSERLPEDGKEVLITVKRRAYGFDPYIETYIGKYDEKLMLWISRAGNFGLDVLAWMPLPEPYQEDNDD